LKNHFFKEDLKSPLDRHAQYLTMGESNQPDYKVPISFTPEREKDPDEGDKKGVLMKLTLDINGKFIDNPTTQVHPVYNQGTIEQYFKWLESINSILRGQTITEKFRLALQMLRGTYAALWQQGWDAASPQIAEAVRIDPELQELYFAKRNNGTNSACFEGSSRRI
jgi:hypothetical protein